MSKGMHSLCVPTVPIAGTMSYVPLFPGIQHKSQLKVVNQINFTWWMNEWSFQAGPITNTPWSFLLPFLFSLCLTFPQPGPPFPLPLLLSSKAPPLTDPPWLTPSSAGSLNTSQVQNSLALELVTFQDAHCHFRCHLLRSMTMQSFEEREQFLATCGIIYND